MESSGWCLKTGVKPRGDRARDVDRNAGIVVGALATVLALVLVAAASGFSASTLLALVAPTSTPTALPGEVILLKPLADLTSLNATVRLDVNGLINGERAQGELYIVVNSLIPVCVKPQAGKATAALDEMSPESLLGMLTGSDVARGKLVGQKTLNGAAVKHYVIDGDTFLAAAQKSSDAKLKAFGEALWSAGDADLYIDAKGGYPVAWSGSYSGSYEPLKFEGDFDVQIELTGVNTNTQINLPATCNKPISP